jgi:hypothetical protein
VGVRIRHFLVVSWADDSHATLARAQFGLVISARSRIVWVTGRTYRLRLIVGVTYATADRFWVVLFIESDPINRQPEPSGSRTVRSIGWGAVAGLFGGLVFLPIMTIVTGLSQLAGLAGGTSPVVGAIVHLFISGLIGISYGLLFEHESPEIAAGIAWVSSTV